MASFFLYSTIPEEEILKDAKELVKKSEEFFTNNPRRRVATVGVWYGRTAKVRKNHIQKDVDAAVSIALGKQ